MPEDFLARRRKQLQKEGRRELAAQLEPQRPTAVDFIEKYTMVLEALTSVLRTGYRPSTDTLANHQRQVEQWSDADIFMAITTTDEKHVLQEPAHYTALQNVIAQRGRERIIAAGLKL